MPVSTGDTNTSDGEGSRASTGSISLTIIIPLVAIAALALVGGLLWGCRFRIVNGRLARALRHAEGGQITAEELASGRRDRSASTTSGAASGTGLAVGADGRRSILNANGGRVGRARRNLRRTESGRSIRTLPEYSKEAGDEELVLVRQRSASSIEDDSASDDTQEQGERNSNDIDHCASVRSSASRQSTRSHHLPPGAGGVDLGEHGQEVTVSGTAEIAGPYSAPLRGSSEETPRRALSSASRRGWGEAPTYLEAMSSPSFPEPTLEAGVPPPRMPSLRTRTGNSVRDLFSRAGMTFASAPYRPAGRDMQQRHSSTSLLLQPQQSRLSTMTAPSRRSRDGRDASASPYTSPWASTLSLHISSPVPNSAVRASFDDTSFPRAGLSNDQMRFLSSQEAVNMAGVKMGDVPTNKRRRPSMGLTLVEANPSQLPETEVREAPPPTWDEVQAQSEVPVLEARQQQSGDTGNDPNASASLAGDDATLTEPGPEEAHAQVDKPFTSHELRPPGAEEAPAVEVEPPTPIHTTFGPLTEAARASTPTT